MISFTEYMEAINAYGVALFTLGGAAVLLVFILYIDTLRYVIKNLPPHLKAHSALVLGVYSVVAVATYCTIVVPRAMLLAEAVIQVISMTGLYQLFCLFVAYCGGETELVHIVKPQLMNMNVGPCCCWPCCCCLPQLQVNKNNIKFLRLLVIQSPIVQGLFYIALLVMSAERESLSEENYKYVQPFIFLSSLGGIWGIVMMFKMLRDVLKDYFITGKFIVLQIVLLCTNLQYFLMKAFIWAGVLPCNPPATPTVYGNLIYSCLVLSEMVILQIIARRLYKKELPKNLENKNSIEPIYIISTHVSTIANGTVICSQLTGSYKKEVEC